MWKYFLLLSLFIASITCVSAQTQLSIKIKAKVDSTSACKAKILNLKAQITNISNKRVVIDKSAVWYMLSFEHGASSNTSVNDSGGGAYNENYIIIKPRQSYRTTKVIELSDDFFQKEGSYQVLLTYGQFKEAIYENLSLWNGTIKSNSVTFNIENCAK